MHLLERVSTLLRANLNDILDGAGDPEKISKQILLDMENQLLQVKTQLAIAMAETHRLARLKADHKAIEAEWHRKAEFAVRKDQDDLARAALERFLSNGRLLAGIAVQHAQQLRETEQLRAAYVKLDIKLNETRARVEMLVFQHRRNQAAARNAPGKTAVAAGDASGRLSRLDEVVASRGAEEAVKRVVRRFLSQATVVGEGLKTLEQNDQIEAILLELKQVARHLNR